MNDVSEEIPAERSAGLAIVVSGEGSLPPGAEALRAALRIHGIEAETICDPGSKIPPGSFILSIGSPA